MKTYGRWRRFFAALLLGIAPVSQAAPMVSQAVPQADARPALPFSDNLDLTQCGIPTVLGDEFTGELSGIYGGKLQEALVRLYDSHARAEVVARVWTSTPARAVLRVSGPQLSYLLVKLEVGGQSLEGWVPEPYFKRR